MKLNEPPQNNVPRWSCVCSDRVERWKRIMA